MFAFDERFGVIGPYKLIAPARQADGWSAQVSFIIWENKKSSCISTRIFESKEITPGVSAFSWK
jgi:hypothetical protein